MPIKLCKTDEEFQANEYLCELWQEWQDSLPTEQDLADAFPKEYKQWLRQRLVLLKKQQNTLVQDARGYKNKIATSRDDAWIYECLIEKNKGEQEDILREINRISWILNPVPESALDIDRAKAYPITRIIEFKLRKGKCPWHDDKHPSLQYYPKSNTVWCFACNKGGDSIDVAQAVWNIEFKEAVRRLAN